MKQIEVISGIWNRLTKQPFTLSNLAEQIINDGGKDIEPLTKTDLISLMEQKFEGNWNAVAFSFSELLSYYSVPEKLLSGCDVAAWCFVALIMGEASRKEAAEWDREFNFLMTGFEKIRGMLEVDEALFILRHTLAERGVATPK